MPWQIFKGSGSPTTDTDAWRALPAPPPWRDRSSAIHRFVVGADLLDAVNAALHLRRPLLLTGSPGSGKSTLASLIAAELHLGKPLNWHVTSRSTLIDALYQYDTLGRLHATQSDSLSEVAQVEYFVTLGPLGTALAAQDRPRTVLIDEIDKSDFDLPGDLLNVLEEGEFEIPALVRDAQFGSGEDSAVIDVTHCVRGADRKTYSVKNGLVRRTHWPIIVLTSNGERTFPAPFLRRCVRFEMPTPNEQFMRDVVKGHLEQFDQHDGDIIGEFARRVVAGEKLAVDQLLNYLYLVSGESAPDADGRERVAHILLEELIGK
jgi:MoxR-like ATPase